MNKKRKGILDATVLVLLVRRFGAGTVLPSLAQDGPPPIAVTDDVRAQFNIKLDGCATEVLNLKDASRTVVAKIIVRPGAQFPWHTHPGLLLVNLAQGQLVYVSAQRLRRAPVRRAAQFLALASRSGCAPPLTRHGPVAVGLA